jgi:heptosyltransferase I
MSILPDVPPKHICILRLSAVGDICHVLPVVRTLQHIWPETKLTWIIGKLEHQLVGDIPGIEFIIFDKRMGLKAYLNLKGKMRHRQFDLLLHMQMSLRASIASLLIPARVKLGFDKTRASDLQWLFTNQRIPYKAKQHVLDSFFGFIEALGIRERVMQWDIPISKPITQSINSLVPDEPYFIISPCSSMSYRNWSVSGYAAIADYIAQQYSDQRR